MSQLLQSLGSALKTAMRDPQTFIEADQMYRSKYRTNDVVCVEEIQEKLPEFVDVVCQELAAKDGMFLAEELINDSLLDETIGAHQWVIYNAYNLDLLQYSENPEYYIDNFGAEDAALILKESGLDGLHQTLAFWALYADVKEKIAEALDEIEE